MTQSTGEFPSQRKSNWDLWSEKSAKQTVKLPVIRGMWQQCDILMNPHLLFDKASIESMPMMTSSNGNILALLAICAGNSPVTGEFLAQRPVTRSFNNNNNNNNFIATQVTHEDNKSYD